MTSLTRRQALVAAASTTALTACAIIAVIALTTTLMSRASSRASEAHAGALMDSYAATVTRDISSVIDTVRTGVAAIEGAIVDDPADRDGLATIATAILRTRPDLVGMTLALAAASKGISSHVVDRADPAELTAALIDWLDSGDERCGRFEAGQVERRVVFLVSHLPHVAQKQKPGSVSRAFVSNLVAGTGFEPVTFRL